ncbi:hypothetical protein GE061_010764 [Apolygus lucorum]|uniref:DUF7041 domain-containing protein n=1 Tax=Apolygus lucorum TaxID=248454 RepID=A0A8S9XVJ0_APOLU|nr:hypothetical protein GE061_010764 [Apolygus lucorum]
MVGQNRLAIVHFQPPPFWKTAVPTWFHRLEAGFRIKGILDDNDQYDIVVNALDNSVLVHVTDLLAKPPLTNKYEALKTRLIEAFVDSEDKQLQRLLRETVLGDKRPTYLLREMRELAGNKVSDDLLKSLWLQQIPSNVRTVLAVSGDQSLNALSALADKIVELCPAKTIREAETSKCAIRGPEDPYDMLLEKIETLSRQVEALSKDRDEFDGRNLLFSMPYLLAYLTTSSYDPSLPSAPSQHQRITTIKRCLAFRLPHLVNLANLSPCRLD